jgi:hypothetical protein
MLTYLIKFVADKVYEISRGYKFANVSRIDPHALPPRDGSILDTLANFGCHGLMLQMDLISLVHTYRIKWT